LLNGHDELAAELTTMARKPVYAAGGVVIRDGARPLIAVVQRSKDERWVLPRGKLKRSENPRAGARREATEETGHRVRLHEFLGAITYRASGRPKVVQFWSMQAAKHPSFDLTKDISAVAWLPLPAAILKLSYPLERLFLRHVGRQALQSRQHSESSDGRKRKTRHAASRQSHATKAKKTSRTTKSRGKSRRRRTKR
jgi:8-oxo-dGTP diphosphatase